MIECWNKNFHFPTIEQKYSSFRYAQSVFCLLSWKRLSSHLIVLWAYYFQMSSLPLIFEPLRSNKLPKSKINAVCHLVTYPGWVVPLCIRRQNFCWIAAKVKKESTYFKFISQSPAFIFSLLIPGCYFQKRIALNEVLTTLLSMHALDIQLCWNFMVTKLLTN